MRIWIDLANSPHVPFFQALIREFVERGHEVEITARRFAQTVELAHAANLAPVVISGHGGGGKLVGKAGNLLRRAGALMGWARGRGFDLAVSHNSYAQIVAARALGLKSVTLMDYEHQPANHLAFRLASRVIVPRVFPEQVLRRCGAQRGKVRRYNGIKEDVYLADFKPDPHFADVLNNLFSIGAGDALVVARPAARDALYHRFNNTLFDELIGRLSRQANVKILVLVRTEAQRAALAGTKPYEGENVIVPSHTLDGANLIAAADLVISAGGTMNREAAALGIPAVSVYAGRWAAIDEQLVREGRLQRISTPEDFSLLRVEKKRHAGVPRQAFDVRREVAELILEK